ncbi:hypothetical protein HIM_01240 [Hirsutella minnesotensis 3608]|nr:hypothetical protein HIM_01240 [Hirsutella minnesotensis 3608]
MATRRRVTQHLPQCSPAKPSSGERSWTNGEHMPSAKAQMDAARQTACLAATQKYLDMPPRQNALIRATMVVPEKHLFPRGLDDPHVFDHICVKHHVWITRKKPNVFDVHAEFIQDLQGAVNDLHWCLNDMTVSTTNGSAQFFVQTSHEVDVDARIRVELNARPSMPMAKPNARQPMPAAAKLYYQLCDNLVSSMEPLRTSAGDLKVRVGFGLLQVHKRTRGLGNEVSLADFSEMVKRFSDNGGATLDLQMPNVQTAEKVVKYLVNSANGIFNSEASAVQHRCSVVLKTLSGQLMASNLPPSSRPCHLTELVMTKPEQTPRLDWVMAAPDRVLDWNIRVDACQNSADIPGPLKKAMGSLLLIPEPVMDHEGYFRQPHISLTQGACQDVQETTLRTSVVIPFKSTPFVIEVSIFRTWPGMKTDLAPKTWWSVEFYGLSWDATMIDVTLNERGRNWAEELRFMWPGSEDDDVEERFSRFLDYIIQIQIALGAVDWER